VSKCFGVFKLPPALAGGQLKTICPALAEFQIKISIILSALAKALRNLLRDIFG
jgi:hypothetical protein